MRVLVTGGAGFIGANVATGLAARHPDWEIAALDNLRRRGSELQLPRLHAAGVKFTHGDVRLLDDLLGLGPVDALIECSAEPSALAGREGDPGYVVDTNLLGAQHCLELARRDGAQLVFLSTSRVYPIEPLAALSTTETDTRLELAARQPTPGACADGISEDFPLTGARTLYGATKLAAELLIEEYRAAYGLKAVIDRCGVIAGPWQMGRIDQGVFSYWMLAHHFRRPLQYIGFGGKQVRDLLHVEDLVDLLEEQLREPGHWDGVTVNVGGGRERSLSLLETTRLCAEITGNTVNPAVTNEQRPGDVPIYISDSAKLFAHTSWRPQRTPREVLVDLHAWIAEHERELEAAL